jgi:transposase
MTRRRGRALRGKRVLDRTPQGRWESTTMMSSIRQDGSTACMTIQGATTADVFCAYVKEILVPTLRQGDIVILDNLSSHKSKTARLLIEQAGATLLFLPPYSPDLNPIELMWSKVKDFLRSAKARSQDALLDAIRLALAHISPNDASSWFTSCGYTFI